MIKYLFLILFLSVLIHAQSKCKFVIDEKSEKTMAVGIGDRTVFADTNFAWWYDSEYNNYEINETSLDSIRARISDVSIKIVLGTWCSDSRREVPRFLRILDECGYDQSKLKLIFVDRKKEAVDTEVSTLNITLVPTFIVYRNREEIGRIIEAPKTNLESDLIKIIQ